MTALIVIAVIALLILLFLMIKISLHFEGGEDFTLTLRILWFKLQLFPTAPKVKKEKKKKQDKVEKKEEQEDEIESSLNVKKIPEAARDIMGLLKALLGIIWRKLFKKITLENFVLKLAVSTADAAETALLYPKVSAGVYSGFALLNELFTVKKSEIEIFPDFTREKIRFYTKGDIYLRVRHIFALTIAVALLFFKNRRTVSNTITKLRVYK